MNRFTIRFGSFPWFFAGFETGKLHFDNYITGGISWSRKSDAELMAAMLNGQYMTKEFIVVESM